MKTKRQILVACCLMVAPALAQGQRNVIAAGNGVLSNDFDFTLGRELLSPTRKLGLRLSLDYARERESRDTYRYDVSDSGRLVSRPLYYDWQSHTAGMRLTTHYTPFRWVVRPYVTFGVGVFDHSRAAFTSAVDSVTMYGQTWPALPQQSFALNLLGPSVEGGFGISSHFRRFGAFMELRRRHEYSHWSTGWSSSETYPISFGIRF